MQFISRFVVLHFVVYLENIKYYREQTQEWTITVG